jgi:S-DNA-T family DNA segregation ATPase FtsK/SpoIIIE
MAGSNYYIPMPNKTEQNEKSGIHEICGIIFLALWVIAIFAVASYTPDDISIFNHPPNTPALNFIGPVGAWVSFVFFVMFGISTYLLLPFLLIAGLIGLFKSELKLWSRVGWFFIALFSLSTLLDLNPAFLSSLQAKLNLSSPGGVIGYTLAHRTLGLWIGKFGAGIIAFTTLLVSLIYITNIYPTSIFQFVRTRLKSTRENNLKTKEQDEKALKNQERDQKRLERMEKREARERLKQAKLDAAAAAAAGELDDLFEVANIQPKRTARKTKPSVLKTGDAEIAEFKDVQTPHAVPTSNEFSKWELPNVSILDELPPQRKFGEGDDTVAMAQTLQKTLNDFGIDASVTNVQIGPVVTSYEVKPAPGVRVEKIKSLTNNIALSLKARSIRIQAPIPGRDVVGVEIPNSNGAAVFARQLIESDDFDSSTMALPLNLGQDVGGNNLIVDMAKMPHLLIAGATGAGKTVCMNSLLAGLLMTRTPDELRLMLVDPKIVEFQAFNDLPHLVVPVITDPKKVALGLRWAIKEMESRYKMFAKVGARNIESFNNRPKPKQSDMFVNDEATGGIPETVPYIVIVIDELADIMAVAQADIETGIARLAQLSRATGIHMIIATQRPSVNVITGTIKANLPARIAFQVASRIDSRTILDSMGAEQLLGRGDMLYAPPGGSKTIRAQGSLTTDEEIFRICEFWKEQGKPSFIQEVHQKIDGTAPVELPETECDEDSELLEQAIEVLRQTKRASISSIQRRLRIGYNRAARIMDVLEERGIVGPATDTGPRDILIDFDGEIPQNPNEDNLME